MNTQKLALRLQVTDFLRSLAQCQQCGPREEQENCAGTCSSNPCPQGCWASLQGPRGPCAPQALQGPGPWPLNASAQGRPAVSSPCNSGKELAQKSPETELFRGVKVFRGVTAVHIFTRNHTTTAAPKPKPQHWDVPNLIQVPWPGLGLIKTTHQ